MRSTSRARLVAVLTVGALALVAAGCGSKKTAETTVAPDTTAAAETTVAPDTTAAAETTVAPDTTAAELTGVELAKARIAEFSKTPTDLGLTEAIKSIPKGAKVVYVQCSVPVCASIGEGIKAATEAIGGEYVAIAHQDTADTVQAAFQQAIQANPTMVMTSGNPREWFADELKQLNDKNIPVVGWSIPEAYKTDGFAANLVTGDDYWFNGVLFADYVTAKTEGKGNVLFITIPQFPVLGIEMQGFKDEIALVCPDCKVHYDEVTVPDLIAGKHISTLIADLQADPSVNFIVTGFGDMIIGLPDALAGAGVGAGVPIISQAGTPLNYAMIAAGQQEADMALPTSFLGWRAVDAGLRALNAQDTGVFAARPLTTFADHANVAIAGVPLQILTKGALTDPAVAWPGIEGFEAAFKALWGVS
ncbi:MAG: substrate-binding domain-containing protein [Actinobacteria bacterium]|uniref:Unannotated protein n=1 Tax=freshwater metagenome TaxID=449393 RepID=A0A6J6VAC9_9ZZZZ|nr:substrate-binding domain-containing protein [Actinomycetota bacterium]MSZ05069.1 substrate-binding domain-containing protein [Actinomycetota bacterium]MTB06987.1 substrate-binding domain-containing protein [Actinomycetota bacterium]